MNVWSAQREFVAYGPSHLTVLALFVVGAVTLVWVGRRQTEAQARRFGRVMGGLLLAVFCAVLVYKLFHPVLTSSVPLQLCDVAEVTVAYALWSQRQWAYALTYFWGLVLSSQALITPDIGTPEEGAPDFPHHLFVTFFALHVLVVWSAIYLTWGRGMRPTWRSYRFAIVATLVWAAIMYPAYGWPAIAGFAMLWMISINQDVGSLNHDVNELRRDLTVELDQAFWKREQKAGL